MVVLEHGDDGGGSRCSRLPRSVAINSLHSHWVRWIFNDSPLPEMQLASHDAAEEGWRPSGAVCVATRTTEMQQLWLGPDLTIFCGQAPRESHADGDVGQRRRVDQFHHALNRLTGATYDDGGNQLTWDSAYTYGYDSFHMMRSLQSGTKDWLYVYTADDERLWELNLLTNSGEYSLRDLDGKILRVITETNGTWAWKGDTLYRDSSLLAGIRSTGSVYYHLDHLGTPRWISNATRGTVGTHAYYPFGQESTNPAQNTYEQKFTGHERDTDFSGALDYLDYMHARYYNPMLGRFLTVDPMPGVEHRPQSNNGYAYALSSPTSYVDVLGLCAMRGGKCYDTITVSAPSDSSISVDWVAFSNFLLFSQQLSSWMQSAWSQAQSTIPILGSVPNEVPCYDLGDGQCTKLVLGVPPAGFGGISPLRAPHIFRAAPGHVSPVTAASRSRFGSLFQKVASNPGNKVPTVDVNKANAGIETFRQDFAHGQVWVEVRQGEIINARINRQGSFR